MKPAARRRLVVLVMVVGIPVVLAAGTGWFLIDDGLARRLEWRWHHDWGLPGTLAVDAVALADVDRVVVDGVRLTDEAGREALRVERLDASRGPPRAVTVTAPAVRLDRERLDFLGRLVSAARDLMLDRAATLRLERGRLEVADVLVVDRIRVSGVTKPRLAGRIEARVGDQALSVVCSGDKRSPILTLSEPIELPRVWFVDLARHFGATIPTWQERFPDTLTLQALQFTGGREPAVVAVLRWPLAHPWPVDEVEVRVDGPAVGLVVRWRDGSEPLLVAVDRDGEATRVTVVSGAVPLHAWWPVILGGQDPWIRFAVPLLTPAVVGCGGTRLVIEDGATDLHLVATWQGGDLAADLVLDDGCEVRDLRLEDRRRVSVAGSGRFDRDGIRFVWRELQLGNDAIGFLPEPWNRIGWQDLLEGTGARGAVAIQPEADRPLRLDLGVDGRDEVVVAVDDGDWRAELRDLPAAPLLERWWGVPIQAGRIRSARLEGRGGPVSGRFTLDGLRAESDGIAIAVDAVELARDATGWVCAIADGSLTWRDDALTIDGRWPPPPTVSGDWPAVGWTARGRLHRPAAGADWQLAWSELRLPGVVRLEGLTGTLAPVGDGLEGPVAWTGATWEVPILDRLASGAGEGGLRLSAGERGITWSAGHIAVNAAGWSANIEVGRDVWLEETAFAASDLAAAERWRLLVRSQREGPVEGALVPAAAPHADLAAALAADDAAVLPWPPRAEAGPETEDPGVDPEAAVDKEESP